MQISSQPFPLAMVSRPGAPEVEQRQGEGRRAVLLMFPRVQDRQVERTTLL